MARKQLSKNSTPGQPEILVCQATCPQLATELSQHLKLPLIDALPHKKAWANELVFDWLGDEENGYALALLSSQSGPVSIDFLGGKKNHRRQFGGGKGQPLARAIGLQNQTDLSVLDATAGMGGDAFVLASLGCQVKMVERSPYVAALLNDALQRALNSDSIDAELKAIIERMSLVNQDSTDYLLSAQPEVEVIYLDPMYPEKKKKAAVKKEMKILQQILGPDLDSQQLLAAALQTAKQRVVVKRPAKAPSIQGIQPNAEISSPNTRYDIYSIKALKAAGMI